MDNIAKFGFVSSLVAACAAAAYAIAQLLQVLGYLSHPLDDILIYAFSLCIAPPFMLAMLCLYYHAPVVKRFWAHAALLFAVMYTVFVMLIYVVQLSAVIPYGVSNPALTVTPHSFFWTVDALGYINMGLAALFAVPVFERQGFQKWPRLAFMLHGLITPLVALVYFFPKFSTALLMLASPWCITATGSMLFFAFYFRRFFVQKDIR